MLGYYIGKPDAEGIFIKRLNRFLGLGIINGEEALIHIHDPGRLKELLKPSVKFYAKTKNTGKTRYYLIAVDLGNELVLINSAIHNDMVKWLITNDYILQDYEVVKTEPKFGDSRFDLLLRKSNDVNAMVEVKSVTLERNGVALFPDAPTKRGARHMAELVKAIDTGYEAYVVFLVLRSRAKYFRPNEELDPNFAQAFRYAINHGVKALAFKMVLDRDWYLKAQGTITILN